MSNFKRMGDRELYDYCREAGTNAHKYKRMLCAAIPEVFKRRIYRKYGFGSIHEFGARVGGLSHNMVNEAIRVNEKLKDKPKLKSLIKDVGLSKLARVANIATKETDEKWAKNVKQLSRAALETKIQDERKSLPGQGFKHKNLSIFNEMSSRDVFKINLDPETIQELKILKANMRPGTTWDDVFKLLLSEKKIKKQRARGLKTKSKKICEVPGCTKPATEIHHKTPWAKTRKHENLMSICKNHHELQHQSESVIDKKFRQHKLGVAI